MRASVPALILLVALPARAGAQGIVVESYPGERPGDAGALLAPLMDELAARGYAAGAALAPRIDAELSRSGHELSAEQQARATRLVDGGWRHWVNGEFDQAVSDLAGALELFRSAPATIARDPKLREPMRRALVGVALANKRLGNAEAATLAMAEVVRSFPDLAVDRSTFGPEAKDFYTDVEKDMRGRGVGSLRIDCDDASAVVFVNERYVTLGSTTLADLPAGRYRVYLQRGDDRGRVHVADVEPGVDTTLAISFQLDASLRTHGFVGFEAAGADEARFATALARALGGSGVVVVGIRVVDGRRVIEGAALLMDTGQTLRRAYLPIEPVAPSAAQVRSLAVFLAGGEASADLVVVGPDAAGGATADPAPPADGGGARPLRPWKWLSLSLGLVGAGAGAYWIAIDGDCSIDVAAGGACADEYQTRTAGIVAASAGAALVATGVLLWIKDRPARERTPARAAIVAPLEGGAFVGLAGTF